MGIKTVGVNSSLSEGILIFTGDNGLKLYLCDLHKLILCLRFDSRAGKKGNF